jgi:hypothetical protein
MRYQCTTGLDSGQLNELISRIRQVEESRPCGNGRPMLLDLHDQVVMVLMMLRQNPNQMTVADIFGVSQPTVSRIWRRILPLIEEVTGMHGVALDEAATGRAVLVDGTYVPTGNRASTGRSNYSGKRHCQCLSVQVAADLAGVLLAVSDPVPGARHDAAAIGLTGWDQLLLDANWLADSAYSATTAITPLRKPPGRDLTKAQQIFNHDISSLRCAVERCIAHLKNWKILATGYRGRLAELPAIIQITTRLELYRLGW